jgi:uncharacterized MAPEG superfamily protein
MSSRLHSPTGGSPVKLAARRLPETSGGKRSLAGQSLGGSMMKPEMVYLVWVTILTGLLWIPYILDRITVWGLPDTVGYPENPKLQSPWARRLMAAHANAVENLVIFAALVLAAHAASVSNSATVFAAMLYFWSRAVHALAYTFKVPWVRTLAFIGGFVAQMIFAWQLLAR